MTRNDAGCGQADGERRRALRREVLAQQSASLQSLVMTFVLAICGLIIVGTPESPFDGLLDAIYVMCLLFSVVAAVVKYAGWRTLRDNLYPCLDAQASELWNIAGWIAVEPMFADTPEHAANQRTLQALLSTLSTELAGSRPEDSMPQLDMLEDAMHKADWTGQYSHTWMMFRELQCEHLKYWRGLDEAYRRTLAQVAGGIRLEDIEQTVRLSPHRMITLRNLDFDCPRHPSRPRTPALEGGE